MLTRVLDFADSLGAKLDGHDLGLKPVEDFFFLLQYAKALKTTRAIGLLFFEGYGEDSQALLRVLVEQAIVVRWVHQDPQSHIAVRPSWQGRRLDELSDQLAAQGEEQGRHTFDALLRQLQQSLRILAGA